MSTDAQYFIGDVWVIDVVVPMGSTVTVTVTSPSDDVVVTEQEDVQGGVTVRVPLADPGRYLAVILVESEGGPDVQAFTAWAAEPTLTGELPGLAEVKAYISTSGETSADDNQIQDALDAEIDDQRSHCDIPAAYPVALRQALKRRVARNLAARTVAIAKVTSFGEGGSVAERVTRYDAEVTRFEAPYRRTVVG